jgi:TolA-binding protein
MNSGKNPSMNKRKIISALLTLPLLSVGCSTFTRSNPDAEKAAETDGKNRYSAAEPASPAELKDEKIQHLESTVTVLNSRIQELEGKLQAAETRPDTSAAPVMAAKKLGRQILDGPSAGSKVRASIAPNDPGSGFVNDAAVRAFQQGKMLFDQEKFPESILAFSAFLEGNPEHALASSAQYYIGENYYREGDYAVADLEFQKLASHYPHSPRTSYALVRRSQSAAALGQNEEAKRYRTQAEGLFPRSPALKLLRETPVTAATDAAPIATAPATMIEPPAVPSIPLPRVESPSIEKPVVEAPQIEAPHVEAPSSNAPRARVSGTDLDAPPGGGG